MIDFVARFDTPEGICLTLTPAPLPERFLAWFLDFLLRALLLLVLGLLLLFLGQAGMGLMMVLSFVLFWLYPVVFEVFFNGQTPGKRFFGLVVCHDNGQPVGWQASFLRNLLLLADFLPLVFLVGILCMLFHGKQKRLGDLVAGTLVVKNPKKAFKQAPNEPTQTAKPIAPPIALSLEEQKALIEFWERSEILPPERTKQLAGLLGERSPQTLIGYAAYLKGLS